jgi:hypothetical protein
MLLTLGLLPAWSAGLRGGLGTRPARGKVAAGRSARRLTTAEDALGEVQAALKEAETEFDAAAARMAEAERTLHAAVADRGAARRKRHVARLAHERATTAVAAPAPHRRNRRPAETDAVSHRRAEESSPLCQRPRQTRFVLHSQPIEVHHRAEHWWMVQEVLWRRQLAKAFHVVQSARSRRSFACPERGCAAALDQRWVVRVLARAALFMSASQSCRLLPQMGTLHPRSCGLPS